MNNDKLYDKTTMIVSAYVTNNPVQIGNLPTLIADVAAALTKLSNPPSVDDEKPVPAVNRKRSVFPDHIVCLEDGMKFKSLKRHLMTSHGMTPEAYREKWELPADYPMVAPNYSASRSALAKSLGLGRKKEPEPVVEAPVAKPRGKAKAA